jgi:hypothetical protein
MLGEVLIEGDNNSNISICIYTEAELCVCGKCQLNLNQKSVNEWMDEWEESVSKNFATR